jgi:hypothetical protein
MAGWWDGGQMAVCRMGHFSVQNIHLGQNGVCGAPDLLRVTLAVPISRALPPSP